MSHPEHGSFGTGLRGWEFNNNSFDNAADWVDFISGLFNDLLGSFYEQTDPVDDIDRIYRQQEAQAFQALLDGISTGENDWRDLAAFEVDFLSDVDGFQEYVDEAIASAQYQGLYEDIRAANGNLERISEIFNEYSNSGIETNPYIRRDLGATGSAVSVITGTVDNSILQQIIRDAALGDGILGGEVDFEDLPGYGGIWEGLGRHIKVIFRGINLPFPDWFPTSGIFELPTIGDIFNTITGPWKTAAEDALRNCMKGPDGRAGTADDKLASECKQEQSVIDILVDGIENATSDIYEATSKKVQDIFGKEGVIDRCASNPSGCAQEVFDKLKDIFGEGAVDPTSTGGNIPDWMKVIIIGGAYGDEILGELEDLFGGDINDDGTIGIVGPEDPQPFDCTTIGKFNPDGGANDAGDCEEPCPNNPDISAQSPECKKEEPEFGYCEDGITPKKDPAGTNCKEYEPPIDPKEQLCEEQGRVWNDLTKECEECELPNYVVGADGYCEKESGPEECNDCSCQEYADTHPEECDGVTECTNGAINPPDCNECQNGQKFNTTTKQCEAISSSCSDVDCNSPRPDPSTFEGQTAYRLWNMCCGDTHCPDGTEKIEGFDCNGNPTNPECNDCSCQEYADTHPEECDPEVVNPECNDCSCQEYAAANPEECSGSFECKQQNRETLPDGSCGDCLPGFVPDPEGFDQCIQVQSECNDCSCAEYAAANPEECPDGVIDDGGSDDGGGGGGGGFGGGGGLFDPVAYNITADPQLLARMEFPITDFLAQVFNNSNKGMLS